MKVYSNLDEMMATLRGKVKTVVLKEKEEPKKEEKPKKKAKKAEKK